jgi:NodT family efflux transporter outer membrane factor (OMF) lipoprotein
MKSYFRGAVFRGASACLFALSLSACVSTPPNALDRPGDVPAAFTAPANADAPLWPDTAWWNNFKADELGGLMQTAHAENLDIAQAAARVLQAEANDGVALSNLFPSVGLQGSYQRSGGNSQIPRAHNAFTAGLSASYSQNFWGLEFDQLRAARQSLRAARYAATIIGQTIEADVADEYFTILALRERIAIARSNIEAAKRILTLTEAKVSSGVLSNLELAEQQAVVAQQESRLPGLIEQEKEARYGLAILMGRAPEGYDIKGQNLDDVVSPAVKPGMPSELLGRRPDVAEAEAQLYAAHANLDAARAAFFPSLSLTGSGGYASNALSGLISPPNLVWSLGASLFETIFDAGRIKAESDLARARQTELIANYRKTVFSAFSDVESALGIVRSIGEQLALIDIQTKASAEAFRISELQYREGTIDILTLLTAQQNLFSAQDALVQTKLARLEANIGLYVALGGGWQQQASDDAYKPQLDWWPL